MPDEKNKPVEKPQIPTDSAAGVEKPTPQRITTPSMVTQIRNEGEKPNTINKTKPDRKES